jgi:hypothetical protein
LTVSRSHLPSWVAGTNRNERLSCRYVRMNEGQSPADSTGGCNRLILWL